MDFSNRKFEKPLDRKYSILYIVYSIIYMVLAVPIEDSPVVTFENEIKLSVVNL